MHQVIVIPDSQVLRADPRLRDLAWRILINARGDWGVRLLVPRVVLTETIAGYQRDLTEAKAKAEAVASALRRHQGEPMADAAIEEFDRLIADYPTFIAGAFSTSGVELVDPPNVPHMDLVERAARRRRPCDDKGDGYRDSLNWLLILQLLGERKAESIIFVSKDKDFRGTDGQLHPELADELAEIGGSERFGLVATISDVVVELAKQVGRPEVDHEKLAAELSSRGAQTFATKAVTGMVGTSLNPRQCGLPRETLSAVIAHVYPPPEVAVEFAGEVREGAIVATFSAEAQVELLLRLPGEVARARFPASMLADTSDETANLVQLRRMLVFSGIVELGVFDDPADAAVTDVRARPDEAGLKEWEQPSTAISGVRIPQGFMEGITPPAIPADIFKGVAVPPSVAEQFRAGLPKPEVLDQIANALPKAPQLPPEFWKSMPHIQAMSGDVWQWLQRFAAQPESAIETENKGEANAPEDESPDEPSE